METVFIIYSHKDEWWKNRVVRHLGILEKENHLKLWNDLDIQVGNRWLPHIKKELENAKVVVMMITGNFLTSEFFLKKVVPLILKHQKTQVITVVPVIVKPCPWQAVKWLEKPRLFPTEGSPLSILKKNQAEIALANLATLIHDSLPNKNTTSTPNYSAGEGVSINPLPNTRPEETGKFKEIKVLNGHLGAVMAVEVSPDGKCVISGSWDKTVKIWNIETGECLKTLKGHSADIQSLAVFPDGLKIASASRDRTLKIWDIRSGNCLTTLEGHEGEVTSVSISPDGKRIISGSNDKTIKVWNSETNEYMLALNGHKKWIGWWATAFFSDSKTIVSGSWDNTIRMWDIENGVCLSTMGGHSGAIFCTVISPDGKTIVSGSSDYTIGIWDVSTKQLIRILEGHLDIVYCIKIIANGKQVISGSKDGTLNIWDIKSGRCLVTQKILGGAILGMAVTPDQKTVVIGTGENTVRFLNIPAVNDDRYYDISSTSCASAKVVIVGESEVGKTGLFIRLIEGRWEQTEPTHRMKIQQLELDKNILLPEEVDACIAREIWLWDFAGQPDYRLINQLFMDETSLALVLLDPRRSNPFENLSHWEKALNAAVKHPYAKILVSARCDRSGSDAKDKIINRYSTKMGYHHFLTTSAKEDIRCKELKMLIAKHIPWEQIKEVSTTKLLKTLKDAILDIKCGGMVLVQISALQQQLKLKLPETKFDEKEFLAAIVLLENQGLIMKLAFGDFILLQPEYINQYASAVVSLARESSDEIGSVSKNELLEGKLDFRGMNRLDRDNEKILLIAMLKILIDRCLCFEEDTSKGPQLIFPSYFNRDRPDQPKHPNIHVIYNFSGPLEEIYSTLVVRLYYTSDFEKYELWKNAADFTTHSGKQVGLLLETAKDDSGILKIYFDPDVPDETKVSFINYIHRHLHKKGKILERQRVYVCPKCNTSVESHYSIKMRLQEGLNDIGCCRCDARIPLIDSIELKFASNEPLSSVQTMDKRAQSKFENKRLEQLLVGQVMTITSLAGQIYRDLTSRDWGIDAEIEFTNQKGEADGKRLYLQLKSGDSYLRKRKRDGKEIFYIKKKRHITYWQSHAYPVMLVIRNSKEEIRWMNITKYLKEHEKEARDIVFDGELFTVENLLIQRNRYLSEMIELGEMEKN